MNIISLFSGAGGLDLGLIKAGNTVIWANDIDKDAVSSYKENIGTHIICEDIKNAKTAKQVILDKKNEENRRAMTHGIVIPGKEIGVVDVEE